MNKLRVFTFLALALLLQACKHPLEIVGEGDIIDTNNSGHGCTLEQFQAGDSVCTENEVTGDYFVNYTAEPRPGWHFVRWDGPCAPTSEPLHCRIDAPAAWVELWDAEYGDIPIPATVAVFVQGDTSTDEQALFKQIFGTAYQAADLASEVIALAAEALWFRGDVYGTLTQNAGGAWSWSGSPQDSMVLDYHDGTRVVFVFTTVDGYFDGTAEDFTLSHELDFTVQQEGVADLRIESLTSPDENQDISWNRNLTGSVTLLGSETVLELGVAGTRSATVEAGYASFDYQEQYTGTATTTLASLSISETAGVHLAHNSTLGQHASNNNRYSNTSATMNGHSYGFLNASASWAAGSNLGDPGTFNVVIDTNYWSAAGSFYKDGTTLGRVAFDGPVIDGSNGPNLVLVLDDGQNILLHTLLD